MPEVRLLIDMSQDGAIGDILNLGKKQAKEVIAKGWAELVNDVPQKKKATRKKKKRASVPQMTVKDLAETLGKIIIEQGHRPTTISAFKGIAEIEGLVGVTREIAAATQTYVQSEWKRIAEESEEEEKEEKGPTIAEQIVGMVRDEKILLFTNHKTESYAQISKGKHIEILEIKDRVFKEYLTYQYHRIMGRVPNANALRDAINTLSALATNEGPMYKLHNRVAWHDKAIWYDLSNDKWEVVRIDENGWEILPKTPIPLFRRFDHQKPQVYPIRDKRQIQTRLRKLNKFHNHADKKNRILDQVSLIFNLVPNVPHPASIVYGPAGSGKTLGFHRPIKLLVDPSSVDQGLSLPRKKGDFPLQLDRHYYIIYSNLTKLQWWQSDVFCRAIDGAAYETRKLYTNAEIQAFQYLRCIGLNGIPLVATQEDLLDRSILFPLESLAREKRMDEEELLESFEQVRPLILGAMLDALSAAMKIRPTVNLGYIERLGAFTKWGYAIAKAIGRNPETFLKNYRVNRQKANEEVVRSHALSNVIMEFMHNRTELECAPKVLFIDLTEFEFGNKTPHKDWPKTESQMSRDLGNLAQALDRSGLKVKMWRDHSGRHVSLVWHEGYGPRTFQETLETEKKSDDGSSDTEEACRRDTSDGVPSVVLFGSGKNEVSKEGEDAIIGKRRHSRHAVTEPKTKPEEEPAPEPKPEPKKKTLPRAKQRLKEWLSELPNEGRRGFTEADGLQVYGKKFHNRLYHYVGKHWLEQRGESKTWWIPKEVESVLWDEEEVEWTNTRNHAKKRKEVFA